MPVVPIIIGGVVAVAIIIWLCYRQTSPIEEAKTDAPRVGTPERTEPILVGTPVFTDQDGKKMPCSALEGSQAVWIVGPMGPKEMWIYSMTNEEAVARNADYEAKLSLKQNYFSASVSQKLGIPRDVWCLDDVCRRTEGLWYRRNHGSSISYGKSQRTGNADWVRDNTILGDFFDITEQFILMLMYDMFHEFDYYQDTYPLDEQVEEDASMVLELSEKVEIASQESEEQVQQETDIPVQEEVQSHIPSYEEETTRYSPPAYEPPADTGYSGGSDSGGYDSGGGDCGGGGDD